MTNSNNHKEPNTAPAPHRWYPLSLGSSFRDNSSTKFCTLRYEFKPASIDKNQAGSLHKSKENRVTVEFNNNLPGKPKVTFEGSSEDYKDNDAVLFFDGETFKLERLHRAVKRLRHVRIPGESAAAGTVTPVISSAGPATESRSPPLGKAAKPQLFNRPIIHSIPIEVEKIDVGEPEDTGARSTYRSGDYQSSVPTNLITMSPDLMKDDLEEDCDIDIEGDDMTANKYSDPTHETNAAFVINIPNQNDTDDEIADVDVSDDDGVKGPNAAEALRAQVNAEGGDSQSPSSSGSSGSGSSRSGSGSGSSSSDSDDDSVSSGGDIDI